MPSFQTDNLFRLIKTMTKSEKRSFKLYVNRIGGAETAKFIQLFDVLDKQKTYDEESIFIKIPSIKRSQLSNLKRHLYKQMLTSLRLIHISKNVDIEIREQIDFAKILYGKGLYLQSLKILDRVKSIAINNHQDLLHLEILEFIKIIEGRHITNSIENRADELAQESANRTKILSRTTQLSNLTLKLYGYYLRFGHVKDKQGAYAVEGIFKANLPDVNPLNLTFFEKVYLYKAYVWYYNILQNFPLFYRYTQKLVDLFDANPDMKVQERDIYMRALNNLLTALFYTTYYPKFTATLSQFEEFIADNQKSFNTNTEIQAFLYIYTAKINKHFIEGSFSEGLKLVPELKNQLKKFAPYLDHHRILIFQYKIACMYFGSGDNGSAIDYLNEIIYFKAGQLRTDIQCYARILHLIAHYELGHVNLLEYLVKSVYRFLAKMEDLNAVQKEILRFLRRELYSNPERQHKAFINLKNNLSKLRQQDYAGRSFLYLDISAWLQSKIEGRTVEEVSRENFLKGKRDWKLRIKNEKLRIKSKDFGQLFRVIILYFCSKLQRMH